MHARSIPQELDEVSQACRERGEATANDEASGVNGASQPPRLRESDLVSICEAYVARSVGTEGVAAAVGGASSAAGSGRGPRQTNVLLKDVFDTTWYLASAKIVYRMERFRQTWSFYGCYFRAVGRVECLRACLGRVLTCHDRTLQKGACCTTLHELVVRGAAPLIQTTRTLGSNTKLNT